MALPKAIQEQLDEVEKFESQQAVVEEPEQQPVETEEPTTSTDESPQQAVQPADDQQEELRVWRERYNTLQSKYNAEVPRLYEQLKTQNEVLMAMRKELEALQNTRQETPTESSVTEKDEEAFGSDLIDLVRRVVRDEAKRALLPQLEQYVTPLKEQVNLVAKTQVMTAQQRFWHDLANAVPDWETINSSQQWLSWLEEKETPWSNRTRQQALDEAQQALDAERVIGMFKAFKETQAPQPQPKAKPDLSKQISPPKSRAASSVPQGDKIWTQAEYLAAMDPRKRNEMGHEAWNRLVEEAERALMEGRVRI